MRHAASPNSIHTFKLTMTNWFIWFKYDLRKIFNEKLFYLLTVCLFVVFRMVGVPHESAIGAWTWNVSCSFAWSHSPDSHMKQTERNTKQMGNAQVWFRLFTSFHWLTWQSFSMMTHCQGCKPAIFPRWFRTSLQQSCTHRPTHIPV